MARHIYVLDTCVLLHDPQAIYRFEENDIYIPLAVIDDLDEIKGRPGQVGWCAREVFRLLDTFNLDDLTKGGAVVNAKGGKLYVYNLDAPLTKGEMPNIVRVANSDNAVIQAAVSLKSKSPRKKVAIVTKDVGLRVRAASMGCLAENYVSDLLADTLHTGIRRIPVTLMSDWNRLYDKTKPEFTLADLSTALVKLVGEPYANEFVVFEYGTLSFITQWKHGKMRILKDTKDRKVEFMGVKAHNLEQKCAMEILNDDEIPLVCLLGPAGVGKTYITLAVALDKVLHDNGNNLYDKLVIIKPTVAVGGMDIGALPGDKFEKLSAWLGPFKDNLQQLIAKKKGSSQEAPADLEELVDNGTIEVEALAYIQGRSIANAIVIVDEVQNLSPRVARMVVERCGKNSKVILLGDLSQVENPYLDAMSCGLAHVVAGGIGHELVGTVSMSKVERSALAAAAGDIFKKPIL